MTALLQNASPLEIVFWLCALVSTVFFVFRVILMLITGGMDVDIDSGHADIGHHADSSFEKISLNTVTAFLMMFGWMGLACYKQFHLSATISILVALVAGFSCMMITAYFFRQAKKLASAGGEFSLEKTVGQKGRVYQRIPAEGHGKITIAVGDMTHEVDAVSGDHKDIESFETVEVLRVLDQKTVSVKKSQ